MKFKLQRNLVKDSHVTNSVTASHDYRNDRLIVRAREKPIHRSIDLKSEREHNKADAFPMNFETEKAIGSSW